MALTEVLDGSGEARQGGGGLPTAAGCGEVAMASIGPKEAPFPSIAVGRKGITPSAMTNPHGCVRSTVVARGGTPASARLRRGWGRGRL